MAKRLPKMLHVVWCDSTWCAFTNRELAVHWSEDGMIYQYVPKKRPARAKGGKRG